MKYDIQCGNLVADVADEQLEAVYGGGGAPLGVAPAVGGLGVGVGASSSQVCDTHVHSFAGTCDINTFSSNTISGWLYGLTSILNHHTQICVNSN